MVHVGCLMCDKSMVLWLTLHFPEERKRISSVQTKRAIHPEFSLRELALISILLFLDKNWGHILEGE